jgi:hypothetical protein
MKEANPMPEPTKLGALIDSYWRIRERKRRLDAQTNEVESELAQLEDRIKHAMDDQKISQGRGSKATATIVESIVPQMDTEDPMSWPKFYAFLHRKKAYHLLERRLSVTGCRELMERGVELPGVVPFKKRKLNVLTLKTATTEGEGNGKEVRRARSKR